MPIPYTVFVDGSDLLPEHVNELFSAPKYDGQVQYLNHYAKLADTSLDPNGVLKRVAAIVDPFKVQVESALSVRVLGGTFQTEDDLQLIQADAVITLPDNSTTFLYKNTVGVLATSATLAAIPKKRALLAKVVTNAGLVTSIEDYRGHDRRVLQVSPRSIRMFGGSSSIDKVCTNNETFSLGTYYFRTFTVPAGVTIFIDKLAIINCQDFACAGTISILPATESFLPPIQNIPVSGQVNQVSGNGVGSTGNSYSFTMQPYGSAGQSGFTINHLSGFVLPFQPSRGGNGGGGLQVNASNLIQFTGSAVVTGRGGNAINAVNYAGAGSQDFSASGGGGGSGATVVLNALNTVTIAATCTVDLRGGNGAAPVVSTNRTARGGSSGAGGYLVANSPTLPNFTGATILLAGGTPGTTVGSDVNTNFNGGAGGGNAANGGQNADGLAGRTGGTGLLLVSDNVPNG